MESFSPYLAGFFDGDGSLCFQIVRQREYRFGFYIRASFSLHQATPAEDGLRAIQAELEGKGYVRRRSGGMSDLVITQRTAIREILYRIRPYVVFKRRQVEEGLILLGRLPPPRDPVGFLEICKSIDDFASLNAPKTRTVTSETVRVEFERMGALDPVTTDP
jgi:hypothetical protein